MGVKGLVARAGVGVLLFAAGSLINSDLLVYCWAKYHGDVLLGCASDVQYVYKHGSHLVDCRIATREVRDRNPQAKGEYFEWVMACTYFDVGLGITPLLVTRFSVARIALGLLGGQLIVFILNSARLLVQIFWLRAGLYGFDAVHNALHWILLGAILLVGLTIWVILDRGQRQSRTVASDVPTATNAKGLGEL